MILEFLGISPDCHELSYVAPSATVVGDVKLGAYSSVWFNATVRADVNRIRIGQRSNIQDNCVVHVTRKTGPVLIGDGVTIGHSAVIHGCTIEDDVLIGMGAILLDGAVIGSGSIVGAGALVTQNTRVPRGSLVLGSPAAVARELSRTEMERISAHAANYVRYASIYRGDETPESNPFYDP